jgi:hypothetical protein
MAASTGWAGASQSPLAWVDRELYDVELALRARRSRAGPGGFVGGMTNKKYAHSTHVSQATAQRDLELTVWSQRALRARSVTRKRSWLRRSHAVAREITSALGSQVCARGNGTNDKAHPLRLQPLARFQTATREALGALSAQGRTIKAYS